MAHNYKLCDFYIASSARTYIPCNQLKDYSSVESIKTVLMAGARYIELDIFNKGFCLHTIPVVTNGTETGNWHSNSIVSFTDCMQAIAEYAFSSKWVKNYSDPLFLCLHIKTEGNYYTLDKVAEIITELLGSRLLDSKYNYQEINIAQVGIKSLLNKLILFASSGYESSNLAKLINHSWTRPFMRNLSHIEINNLYEPEELIEYNRVNLTRVYPDFKGAKTENYNPLPALYNGCQFVCMNYTAIDDNMITYLDKFSKCNFVLKPEKLRWQPKTYVAPLPQDPKVSYKPEVIVTPFYSLTY